MIISRQVAQEVLPNLLQPSRGTQAQAETWIRHSMTRQIECKIASAHYLNMRTLAETHKLLHVIKYRIHFLDNARRPSLCACTQALRYAADRN